MPKLKENETIWLRPASNLSVCVLSRAGHAALALTERHSGVEHVHSQSHCYGDVMADTAKTTPTIAPPVSAQVNETKPAAVAVVADKTPIVPEFTLVDVTTKLRKETRTGNMVDCLLIAHSDAQDVIAQVFDAQDSFENPSKFSRAFLWDAIIAQAKIQCNTAVNDYVRLLDKAARLKPRMTREAVEAELLESRRARAVKERSDKALALKAKL